MGFDLRQPGGLLRTIGLQAQQQRLDGRTESINDDVMRDVARLARQLFLEALLEKRDHENRHHQEDERWRTTAYPLSSWQDSGNSRPGEPSAGDHQDHVEEGGDVLILPGMGGHQDCLDQHVASAKREFRQIAAHGENIVHGIRPFWR